MLFVLWAAAFAWSFIGFAITEGTGDGFARGLNRVSLFIGWQFVAAVLAVLVRGFGTGLEEGSLLRRASWVPIGLAGLLILAVAGLIVWARFIAHP